MRKLNVGAFIRLLGLSASIIIALILTPTASVSAQGHDMQNMPEMKMSKPKAKANRKPAVKKKRVATRKSRTTKKHDMSNMAGMNMSGVPRRRSASGRNKSRAQKNSPKQ